MKARFSAIALLAGCTVWVPPAPGAAVDFHDAHFHISNYVQRGIGLPDFLEIMGDKVGRVALFGIPLQQKWDYFESRDRAPITTFSRIPPFTTTPLWMPWSPRLTRTFHSGTSAASIP